MLLLGTVPAVLRRCHTKVFENRTNPVLSSDFPFPTGSSPMQSRSRPVVFPSNGVPFPVLFHSNGAPVVFISNQAALVLPLPKSITWLTVKPTHFMGVGV